MCGGRKKVSNRDPFPPSNKIPSQRVLPPSASPSPTLAPYSNIERWEGDNVDLSSANVSHPFLQYDYRNLLFLSGLRGRKWPHGCARIVMVNAHE